MAPSNHKLVVIGASAGGVEAACSLLSGLPSDFTTPILVVIHIGRMESALPQIFSRCGPLPASHPQDGERIRPGRIYVAPPNKHLLVQDGAIKLSHGPRENGHRPAIDPLLRTAARSYRSGVIGIILTGGLDDGTAGLFAVKSRGGFAIAQDPAEAPVPSMPRHAIEHVKVDRIVRVAQIPELLVKLSQGKAMQKKRKRNGTGRNSSNYPEHRNTETLGTPVPLACPDCQGPLFELKTGKAVNFHCIVGHSYSPMSLSEAHSDALERALWVAIRTFKERLTFRRKLQDKRGNAQEEELARRMGEEVERIEADIKLLVEIQERI